MSSKTKKLVGNNWLIETNGSTAGLVSRTANGYSVWIKAGKNVPPGSIKIGADIIDYNDSGAEPISFSVHGYPTHAPAYNPLFDIRSRIPVYTTRPNSKSQYAAGWYRINSGGTWTIEFCPRVVKLRRAEYTGPYYTEEQANEAN